MQKAMKKPNNAMPGAVWGVNSPVDSLIFKWLKTNGLKISANVRIKKADKGISFFFVSTFFFSKKEYTNKKKRET